MPRKEDADLTAVPADEAGNAALRPAAVAVAGPRRPGLLRSALAVLACVLAFSALPSVIHSAGLHFGLVSAVKTKVKELSVKVKAHTAPAALVPVHVSSYSVTIGWSDRTKDETGFAIERKTDAAPAFIQIAMAPPDAVTYLDAGLDFGTTYYYRVRAFTASFGWTDYSGVASTTTLGDGQGDGMGGGGGTGISVSTMTSDLLVLSTGEIAGLSIKATEKDGGELTYTWTASSGTAYGTGPDFEWTAPDTTGTYTVNCTVKDSKGDSVVSAIKLIVKILPVINSLAAIPQVVMPFGISTVTCSASEGENVLTYSWSVDSGTNLSGGSFKELGPRQIAWTAPATLSTYPITCSVADPEGGVRKKSVDVWVATGPVIMSLFADPVNLSTGEVSQMTCLATSPVQGTKLTYSWTAASGTASGTGTEFKWTAPLSTGTYFVNCTVSDGLGGTDSRRLKITVKPMPRIASTTAVPEVVLPLGISTITCLAYESGLSSLTYSWSVGGGSLTALSAGVMRWDSPSVPGRYPVKVKVSDNDKQADTDNIFVWVATGPVITSLTANPPIISSEAVSALLCTATSPVAGTLTYAWSYSSGSIIGTGPSVDWIPQANGTFTVTCTVTDGYGGVASEKVDVVVKQVPVFNYIRAVPQALLPLAVSTVTCSVDSVSTLSYGWTAADGEIKVISDGVVAWTAPASSGTYGLDCQAKDDSGETAGGSVRLFVGTGPAILSLSDTMTVSTGNPAQLLCVATSPTNSPLSYVWSAGSGTLSGTGPGFKWTAPGSTGTYFVNCTVYDALGGFASGSVEVDVKVLPVISSMTAVPVSMLPLTVSTITCLAYEYGNPELTYDWKAASGTVKIISGGVVAWTAPEQYGAYNITCDVSDPYGETATRTLDLWVGTSPVIRSLSVPKVSTGSFAQVICLATSPAGGDLGYSWSAGSGTLTGSGYSVSWKAPLSTGTYLITCAVSDGNGGTVSKTVEAVVKPLPVITSVTAVPLVVVPNAVSTITCLAFEPGASALTYKWQADSGTVAALPGNAAVWTAPAETGTYKVDCTVSDEEGDSKYSYVFVWVATGPVITSVKANPLSVASLGKSALICEATSPVSGVLSYSWAVSTGELSGSGYSVSWRAPVITGSYSARCSVSDGLGGSDYKDLGLLINNPPVISTITVAPTIVPPSGISTATCVAADPDGPDITYGWVSASGTFTPLGAGEEKWAAPAATGSYAVGCRVTDPQGASDYAEAMVWVATGPVIFSLKANPDALLAGDGSDLVCLATSPANYPLSYTWASSGGSLVPGAAGLAHWTAPAELGVYTTTCSVSDGHGGQVSALKNILVDNPPVISSVTASPGALRPLMISNLACYASDSDSPVLEYSWEAPAGTITITGLNTADWTAAESTGTYDVTCKVTDGDGGGAQKSVSIIVATQPVIISIIPGPEKVPSYSTSTVVCLATAPDSAELSYAWAAASGTASGTGSVFEWAAPKETGTYILYCVVTELGVVYDGGSVPVISTATVLVNNPPVISSVTAVPSVVKPGQDSDINCYASDPDNLQIFYQWTATGAIAGTGPSVTWTAPDSTGTYYVTCRVSDGEGGEDEMKAKIHVATMPVILSLSATPLVISTGSASALVCVGTAAEGGVISYAWSAASGSVSASAVPGEAVWTPPLKSGDYPVYCEVTSSIMPGSARGGVTISVNSPPEAELKVIPGIVLPDGTCALTCSASDPDGDELKYTWSADTGTMNGTEQAALWTAPGSTGTYNVYCRVSDGKPGGTTQKSVAVIVSSLPVITELSIDPHMVARSGSAVAVCVATAPGNGELLYSWSVDSGSINGSSTGQEMVWDAPSGTGTSKISCVVSVQGREGSAAAVLEVVVDSPPQILTLEAVPAVVAPGAQSQAVCSANDADGEDISYAWKVSSGGLSGLSGQNVTWTAPESTGSYQLTCTASDGHPGASSERSLTLTVATVPVITDILIHPEIVGREGVSTLICVATMPGGVELSYLWSAGSGTPSGAGDTFAWTAPDATGTYRITCEASAAGAGSASRSALVTVNTAPVISSMTAEPAIISTAEISGLACVASDDDGDDLSYAWTAASGTVIGYGDEAGWTSPPDPGKYSVYCDVSDGKNGGDAQAYVKVVVATQPVITSIKADPATVARSSGTYVVCSATAPHDWPLTYVWSAASGTPSGSGPDFIWTAPPSTGTYLLYCGVTVPGREGGTSGSVEIVVNSPPVLTSISAYPAVISTLSVSAVSCTASDPDGDEIAYSWSASTGSFSGSGGAQLWTSPASTGTYSLSCKTSDGKPGGDSESSINVLVTTAPVILSVTASPKTVPGGTDSYITCLATAAENGELVYTWSAASGTHTGSGKEFTWTAPDSTGTYMVSCEVSVAGRAGSALDTVAVTVNSAPQISSFTAAPLLVSTMSVSALSCLASDPDGEDLVYTWTVGGGVINGSGPDVSWTSPVSTGSYKVTCEVSDGKDGGSAQENLDIRVTTLPYITEIGANPQVVAKGAVADLVCVATAPDKGELVYTWTPGSGTVHGTAPDFTWTAPDSTGTYALDCDASIAGKQGYTRGSLEIMVNSPPVISSASVHPGIVSTMSVSSLSCEASDPDGDDISYLWVADAGQISGPGAETLWTSPTATGTYNLTCKASDGKEGGTGQKTLPVIVTTLPVIVSINASPEMVARGADAALVCLATAPDSGVIDYSWYAASGTPSGSGPAFTWTAPGSTGTYSVTCTASVAGRAGSASGSVRITVNSPPSITGLSAVPSLVSTKSVSEITCSASDPDNDDLLYTWDASSGTIAGSGAVISWTSPVSTGTYQVTCKVSDGGTSAAQDAIQVTVATQPVISALTASPPLLAKGAQSYLVCTATAPGGVELVYDWNAASGSVTGTGATAYWTAPEDTGTFRVYCAVSVAGREGGALAWVNITVNSPPVISDLTAEPSVVDLGAGSALTCTASDSDGDHISYSWTATDGHVSGTDSSAVWTAPVASTGSYSVTCHASDGKDGGDSQRDVEVLVATGPVLKSLTALAAVVPQNAVDTFVCVATAPNNAALTYTWSAASGTQTGTGSTFSWTAPAATGTFIVACEAAAEGFAGKARGAIEVLVNTPPVASLSAEPALVSTGAVSAITCAATDEDGDELTYTWSASSGQITGTGTTAAWKAPLSTGSYTVTCRVSDGKSFADATVSVKATNSLTITALSASAVTVEPLAASTLVCVATAPDSAELTYLWTATGGTPSGSGPAFIWTAPGTVGSYSVTCAVSAAGLESQASQSLSLIVNSAPKITSISAEPTIVSTGKPSKLLCVAGDADGDALTYSWSATIGTASGAGPSFDWTAPGSTGSCVMTCSVTDGTTTATATQEVKVTTSAEIISLTAVPAIVSPLASSALVCVATAPDNAALTYTWTAASGTPTSYTGSDFTWTAPAATGTYYVTCGVSAPGLGGVAQTIKITVNGAPEVTKVTAEPAIVSKGKTSLITCSASDPDGGVLEYSWSANGGDIGGTAPSAVWTAPESTGSYSISCTASDGISSTVGHATVTVATVPAITTLTASPLTVPRGGVSDMVCVATAPDNAALTYTWSAASGTKSGSGPSFSWTAPADTGTYSITCEAAASGLADSASGTLHVLVNSVPVVAPIAEPATVSTGKTSLITCNASDPDGGALTYVWSATDGAIGGTASSATWTAPLSTGAYSVTCAASDGLSVSQGAVNVTVATSPVITQFSASPLALPRLGVSDMVCVATAPDNAALTYTWTATSGTPTSYSGSNFSWTAPDSTGTYMATCEARAAGIADSARRTAVITVNTPPAAGPVTGEPMMISTGAQTALHCKASDADGDALTYVWTAAEGSFTGEGENVSWKAPASSGSYTIVCGVSDGKSNGSVSVSANILVATVPVITKLEASDNSPSSGETIHLVCVATAPDNAVLSYFWSSADGVFTSAAASETDWTAPAGTGIYGVTCRASAAGLGQAFGNLSLTVNNMPVITSISASPTFLSTASVSHIYCPATDADAGDTLGYTWTDNGGSVVAVGLGTAAWTSPLSTGSYSVTCAVSDGHDGGSVQSSISLTVATIPVINDFSASPSSLKPGETSAMVCLASATDNGVPVYAWTASGGLPLSGGGSAFNWTAPAAAGTYVFTCDASVPGRTGSARKSMSVEVNTPPLISNVTTEPAFISTMSVSTLTCLASDADSGDTLTYTWNAVDGVFSGQNGNQVRWTSPLSSGTYTINCSASDGHPGGTAQRSTFIQVSSIPVISDLHATPPSVSTGTVSTMTCVASAPAGEAVNYSWYASSGSTSSITGDGSQMRWTAPASTGTCIVTCVAAGAAGASRRTLAVLINNPPVISALTADPGVVRAGDISTVTCSAHDPDNTVIYSWQVPNGGYKVLSPGQIAWTAPPSSGTFTVGCVATDGEGGLDQKTVGIEVKDNSAPVINSLSAFPATVLSSGTATINCLASDADGDALTYTWSAASGTPHSQTGTGTAFVWSAPGDTGTYRVTCTVFDGKDGTTTGQVFILVNNPPGITYMSIIPQVVAKNGTAAVSLSASDIDNPKLYYAWTASSGTVAATGDGTATWTAPDSTGSYTVTCDVTDGEGGSAVRSVPVSVSTRPVINSLTASPSGVAPGGSALLTCDANGLDGEPLSYYWYSVYGSTSGSGTANITWKAPVSTGTYQVLCRVTGSNSHAFAESVLSMQVNTVPDIISLTAAHTVVSPSVQTLLTCNANDADGDPLTYTWNADSGPLTGTGNTRTWTAPASSGTYPVSCSVSDGKEGGTAQTSVLLYVSSTPLVTSLTADPASVLTNGVSTITCVALDPDANDTLTYTWQAQAGNMAAIAGDGSQMRWTSPASSGTYKITCTISDGHGGVTISTLAMVSGGLRLWTRQAGNSGSDYGYSVAVDTSGFVYTVGNVIGHLQFDTTAYGGIDAFLSKRSSAGDLVWSRQMGTSDSDSALGVVVDSKGYIVLTGYKTSNAFVAKYDEAGNNIWTGEFGPGAGYGVAVDTSGNIFVAGGNVQYTQTPSSAEDSFIVKYSSSGTQLWSRQLGTDSADRAYGVAVDTSGAVFLAGTTGGHLQSYTTWYGNMDAFIAKYSNDGNLLSVRQLGTTAEDEAFGISADAAGGINITGQTKGSLDGTNAGSVDGFVAKYDTGVNLAWVRQFGTSGYDKANAIASGNGYVYVVGGTQGALNGNDFIGTYDIFLIKYDAAGNYIWTQEYGSPLANGNDLAYGVAYDPIGNVYLTGATNGSIDGQTYNNAEDIFLSKYAQ